MTQSLRLKIQFKDGRFGDVSPYKFVYVVGGPDGTTIRKLIALLQEFITGNFGAENLHVMQLVTEDGYLLMEDDFCSNVLMNNDQLVCVDMYHFINENLLSLNTDEAWFTLGNQDGDVDDDDATKKLVVGMSSRRQVYVYLFGNDDTQALHLFKITDLLTLARDTKNKTTSPAMKISGTTPSNWLISAEWERESTGSDTRLYLLGQLKANETSEIQKGRFRLDLNRESKTVEHWEVMQLSHPIPSDDFPTSLDPARLKELKSTIPPLKRTGPVIDTSIITDRLQMYESQGDSAIQMMQGTGSSVETKQGRSNGDGTFRQLISISHIIVSKKQSILPEILTQKQTKLVEKAISVARINVQYQRSDGKWLDCEEARLVLTDGGQKLASSILNIEPDKLISISVEASIQIKGEANRRDGLLTRAHRSLPQPLKLKIIVTDNVAKTCSLIVEQLNKPLVLITKERFLERESDKLKKLIAFIDADDCQFDERIFIGIYIDTDDHLVITKGYSSVRLQKSQIRSEQAKAKKNRKAEELIEYISDSNVKAIMLFDPETFLLYAVRIEVITSTSQTIETVFVPLDEIK